MILLNPEHRRVLKDVYTWRDNPFVLRDSRRDRKRQKSTRFLAWMCLVLLLLGGLLYWGLSKLMLSGYGVPWFLGGEWGTSLTIALAGIHVWFIISASQKNVMRIFMQEASKNTLATLFLLPIPPFQMAVSVCVYPWLAGMRMALLLLPLYVFCVGVGGISWLDLLMLYAVFALTAISVPLWNRPAMSENLATVIPTGEKLGVNRDLRGNTQATGQANTTGVTPFGSWVAYAGMMMLQFISVGRRGISFDAIHAYVPESIVTLLPSSILSWPLLIGRTLITPLDWFGWTLPPILFVVPLFFINRYNYLVRVSEFLSVGAYRDLVQTPTYLPRRRLEGAVRIVHWFVLVGYLWKWWVVNGALGWIVTGRNGQLGLLYLLLFIALWRGMFRAYQVGAWVGQGRKRAANVSVPFARGAHYLLNPFCFLVLFYLACCLLSRTNPFPPQALLLAGKMLAIGLVGVVCCYASARIYGLLPLMGTFLASYALFGPEWARPLAYLSPTLGMVNLGRPSFFNLHQVLPPPTEWAMWVSVGWGAAAFLLLLMLLVTRLQPRQAAAPGAIDPTQVGMEVFADPAVAKKKEATDTPLALRLIMGLQRFYDNGVAIKELRAKWRGKMDMGMVMGAFVACLVISLSVSFDQFPLAKIFGSGLVEMLYGSQLATTPGPAQTLAAVQCCWFVVYLLFALFGGFNVLPNAFSVEQEKSTLSFLLMTPLRASEIVLGKLTGLLLSSNLTLALMGIWTLILSAALVPLMVSPLPLLLWAVITLTALVLLIWCGMMAMALSSLFPRLVAVKVRSVLHAVLIYATIGGISFLSAFRRSIPWGGDWSGWTYWLLGLVVCLLLTVLAALIATVGVRRMRKNDLTEVKGVGR